MPGRGGCGSIAIVAEHDANPNVDLVHRFLRGQNLEQVARVDEAVELYETILAAGFDSVGPYDRLIEIYSNQARHREVVRVAEAALESARTRRRVEVARPG